MIWNGPGRRWRDALRGTNLRSTSNRESGRYRHLAWRQYRRNCRARSSTWTATDWPGAVRTDPTGGGSPCRAGPSSCRSSRRSIWDVWRWRPWRWPATAAPAPAAGSGRCRRSDSWACRTRNRTGRFCCNGGAGDRWLRCDRSGTVWPSARSWRWWQCRKDGFPIDCENLVQSIESINTSTLR